MLFVSVLTFLVAMEKGNKRVAQSQLAMLDSIMKLPIPQIQLWATFLDYEGLAAAADETISEDAVNWNDVAFEFWDLKGKESKNSIQWKVYDSLENMVLMMNNSFIRHALVAQGIASTVTYAIYYTNLVEKLPEAIPESLNLEVGI